MNHAYWFMNVWTLKALDEFLGSAILDETILYEINIGLLCSFLAYV